MIRIFFSAFLILTSLSINNPIFSQHSGSLGESWYTSYYTNNESTITTSFKDKESLNKFINDNFKSLNPDERNALNAYYQKFINTKLNDRGKAEVALLFTADKDFIKQIAQNLINNPQAQKLDAFVNETHSEISFPESKTAVPTRPNTLQGNINLTR